MNAARHEQQVAALRQALEACGAGPGWEHPCSYLPDRAARDLALRVDDLEPGVYHALMDLNFRRSGHLVYRPQCAACSQCRAVRVPAGEFSPNRTQRRCWKANQALAIGLGAPELTAEKHALYERYLERRHDRQMDGSWCSLHSFLYQSPVHTSEVVYRRDGRLVAVGILDIEPDALSTVYCYYDPDCAGSSLGVFNVLWTLNHARRMGVPYVYLGYYIRDCAKMNYKLNYRPCELLRADGSWERVDPA